MLNKVMLIGRTNKIELKTAENGTAVTTFSMATNKTWKDKSSGETRETTQWHRVVAFGKTAEICGEYLTKGSLACVEGHLRTRIYEKEGEKRFATQVVVDQVLLLDKKPKTGGDAPATEKK